jgi:hypothetical protein
MKAINHAWTRRLCLLLAGAALLALVAMITLLLGPSALAIAGQGSLGAAPLCGTPPASGTPKPCVPNATPLPKPSPLPAGCLQDLACVKRYADAAVTLRVQALDDAIARANGNPCLNDKQRPPIVQQLQAGIAGVQQLQAKFDAETDPTAVKADLQQLFGGLAIFSIVVPRAFAEMTVACQDNTLALFQSGVGGVQTAIDNVAKAGKDVTQERALIADMQQQLGDAQTQVADAQALLAAVNPSTPAAVEDAMRTLGQVKGDALTVTRDLQAARDDLARITGLLSGKPQGPADTPRPKPTSVPGTPASKGTPTPTPTP